jgi:hypothetical protein
MHLAFPLPADDPVDEKPDPRDENDLEEADAAPPEPAADAAKTQAAKEHAADQSPKDAATQATQETAARLGCRLLRNRGRLLL